MCQEKDIVSSEFLGVGSINGRYFFANDVQRLIIINARAL